MPGREPRGAPACTAGRVCTIRATSRFISADTAIATARNDLPVPAGPMAKTMSCLRIASTYRFWPGVFGVIHFFRDGTARSEERRVGKEGGAGASCDRERAEG